MVKKQFIGRQKKYSKIWSQDLMHEEPFGYQVAHYEYNLKSCPGPLRKQLNK